MYGDGGSETVKGAGKGRGLGGARVRERERYVVVKLSGFDTMIDWGSSHLTINGSPHNDTSKKR